MADPPAWLVKGAAAALRTRWFVRSPIGMYQRGWGWMLGDRMLMLEHRGRTSGLKRQVVLEVIDHPSERRYLVVAGFGERAQWLRNVRAEPSVRVSIGRLRSAPATATELGREEADAMLARYRTEHPFAWKVLSSAMADGLDTDISRLPVVALDLHSPPDAGGSADPQ